jgi:tRNA pseudouridine38-40 synthase
MEIDSSEFLASPPPPNSQSAIRNRNLRLVLQYEGTHFHGWQIQRRLDTIQGVLTTILRKITFEEIHVHGCGRTDAGTHALAQVCNFETACTIPPANFLKAINTLLPPAIRVVGIDEVPMSFHSRRDARWKHYRYRIVKGRWCSPFDYPYAHHFRRAVDFAAMCEAARRVLGEHDFTSFCDAASEVESKVRRVMASFFVFDTQRQLMEYNVCADGFLHHMVRNLVGTFLEIGKGNWQAADIDRILEARNRSAAGPTVPAKGLFLVEVGYETNFPGPAGGGTPRIDPLLDEGAPEARINL